MSIPESDIIQEFVIRTLHAKPRGKKILPAVMEEEGVLLETLCSAAPLDPVALRELITGDMDQINANLGSRLEKFNKIRYTTRLRAVINLRQRLDILINKINH